MLIAARERLTSFRVYANETTTSAAPPAPAAPLARAELTVNLYARPDRTADVVTVLPARQTASVEGRTADGEWLRLAYPPGSASAGWARSATVRLEGGSVEAFRVLTPGAAVPVSATVLPTGQADPAIADVFLIDGKHLAISLRNLGATPLTDVTMTLDVTTAGGEMVGILTVGPATLAAGANATVVTPLEIRAPGTYRVRLNPGEGLADVGSANNALEARLFPSVD